MTPQKRDPRVLAWIIGLVAAAAVGALIWWPFVAGPDVDPNAWEVVPNLLLFAMLTIAGLVVPVVLLVGRFGAALRSSDRGERARASLRAVARPVWHVVIVLMLLTAGGTFITLRLYLAAAERGWGDAFLWVSLAGFTAIGVQLVVLIVAGMVADSRRSFHGGMIAGVATLTAVTASYLAVYLPIRIAYRSDPDTYPSGWNLGHGDLLVPFDVFTAALLLALPWPVLGAALGARSVELHQRAQDGWDRLLLLVTAGLRNGNRGWGMAMRAELANIEGRRERRGFALGCALSALRLGPDRVTWLVGAGAAGIAAVGTFAASRASLVDGAAGIALAHGSGLAVIVFVATLVCALRHRSFRDGLQGGAIALLAAFVASYGVGISESIVWADRRAGYLTTGDAVPPSAQAAVLDLLRPEFVLWNLNYGLIAVLLAAAMGALMLRRPADEPEPARAASPPHPSLHMCPDRDRNDEAHSPTVPADSRRGAGAGRRRRLEPRLRLVQAAPSQGWNRIPDPHAVARARAGRDNLGNRPAGRTTGTTPVPAVGCGSQVRRRAARHGSR